MFKFETFNSPNKGNAAIPDKLKGFIQKWITAGVAVRLSLFLNGLFTGRIKQF